MTKIMVNGRFLCKYRFRFNEGNQTGFLDSEGIINVRGDVLPDLYSNHPRDLMSPRAVLAHEYYGHKHFDDVFGVRNPLPGSWNDEFRPVIMRH